MADTLPFWQIGCAALAFNYTFPSKIAEPPYNWPEVRAIGL